VHLRIAADAVREPAARKTTQSPTDSKCGRARIIAFYLPQFHPIPENDEWWGKGFTEWTNVARARPLYPGHLQPRLPSELGYYDLRVAETRAQQSALAQEYGIQGFCYWHYWFEGRRILERPFSEVLASSQPDFPFCLGWANQSWTGIWHGAADRVLMHQTYGGEADARRHFEAILPALLDSRYLCVDGCPIFVVHDPVDLPQSRLFTSLWRQWARAEGLPGIFFLATGDGDWNPHDHGFDGRIIANPWRVLRQRTPPFYDRLLARWFGGRDSTWLAKRLFGWPTRVPYGDVLRHAVPHKLSPSDIPSVLPNWDNTPRSGRDGIVVTGSSPELFARHLDMAISSVESRPFDHRLVFIKSWNEWAEGNFVEPDVVYGCSYLEAIRLAQYARST
jgi:Glycosyltransferase WbsX